MSATHQASTYTQHYKCPVCEYGTFTRNDYSLIKCPDCGSRLTSAKNHHTADQTPHFYLPFSIGENEARRYFKYWLRRRWFLPNDLLKTAIKYEHFQGLLLPFWLFNIQVKTSYQGSRGVNRNVRKTERVHENGKWVNKEVWRTETEWTNRSGSFRKDFQHILILGTHTPDDSRIEKLSPWNFNDLIPFDRQMTAGYTLCQPSIPREQAIETAKRKVERKIDHHIENDIGGDHQRIYEVDNSFEWVQSSPVALPVYSSSYQYKGKSYTFYVNANTGEVLGDRPYSWIKIILYSGLVICLGLLLLGVVNRV